MPDASGERAAREAACVFSSWRDGFGWRSVSWLMPWRFLAGSSQPRTLRISAECVAQEQFAPAVRSPVPTQTSQLPA